MGDSSLESQVELTDDSSKPIINVVLGFDPHLYLIVSPLLFLW